MRKRGGGRHRAKKKDTVREGRGVGGRSREGNNGGRRQRERGRGGGRHSGVATGGGVRELYVSMVRSMPSALSPANSGCSELVTYGLLPSEYGTNKAVKARSRP